MLVAATLIWFFMVQMPGDSEWIPVGNFDSRGTCEEIRTNWKIKHPNFISQPCQREWKEGV